MGTYQEDKEAFEEHLDHQQTVRGKLEGADNLLIDAQTMLESKDPSIWRRHHLSDLLYIRRQLTDLINVVGRQSQ